MLHVDLTRRAVAEFTGTALLLAAVIGSGIMAQRLCAGNAGLMLLANALATGGALVALIAAIGPISGAHFNPLVSLGEALRGAIGWADLAAYIPAQFLGAAVGAILANVMFGLPAVFFSHHERSGGAQMLSEAVATFGLLAIICGCARRGSALTPVAVAGYIVGAYWFTPSTSFANPAVTLARTLSDTFAGIRPNDALPFIAAQCAGALAAVALFAWIAPAHQALRQRTNET